MESLVGEEHLNYLNRLYGRLLEHRYRYYVLHEPVLDDFLYDYIEKEYNRLAAEAGIKLMEMVDFNPNDLLAIEAKNRVDAGTDYHSLWEKEMVPVWEKLGRPRNEDRGSNGRKSE